MLLLMASLLAAPSPQPPDCGEGRTVVATDDPYEPFRCVERSERLRPALSPVGAFKAKPRCPQGTRPVPNPGGLQRYRCLTLRQPTGEPDITPRNKEAVAAPPGPLPHGPAPRNREAVAAPPTEYARHVVPGALEFDYPKGWHLTDAWTDEVPTLYIELDTGRSGKPVTLVVTRAEPRQEGFYPLDVAVARERDWRNAAEQTPRMVGGRRARLTLVRGDSRAAFVPFGRDGGYFTLSYGAPEDLFGTFEPAFERLLDSLRSRER